GAGALGVRLQPPFRNRIGLSRLVAVCLEHGADAAHGIGAPSIGRKKDGATPGRPALLGHRVSGVFVWIRRTASIVSASSGRLSGRYAFTRAKRSAIPPGYWLLSCTSLKAISTTISGFTRTTCPSRATSRFRNSAVCHFSVSSV